VVAGQSHRVDNRAHRPRHHWVLAGRLRNGERDGDAMSEPAGVDRKLAQRLVLDELFDLSLYRSLREVRPLSCGRSWTG